MSAQAWLLPDVVTETKAELRERAKRIHHLVACLDDAPIQKEMIEWHKDLLQMFIEKGTAGKMDLNAWDGMTRNIGDLDEELTKADWRAMRKDESYWTANEIEGWFFMKKGDKYRCRMHPKEVAILESVLAEQDQEMYALESAIPEWQNELERLRAVGPLPEDIAKRLNLTPEGYRLQKVAHDESI